MYLCKDCMEIFEELKHYTETHGLDSSPYEEWDGCPDCGGWACVEAITCCKCSEYIADDYIITVDDETICNNCFNKFSIDDL